MRKLFLSGALLTSVVLFSACSTKPQEQSLTPASSQLGTSVQSSEVTSTPAAVNTDNPGSNNYDGWKINQGGNNPSKRLETARRYHPLKEEAPNLHKKYKNFDPTQFSDEIEHSN